MAAKAIANLGFSKRSAFWTAMDFGGILKRTNQSAGKIEASIATLQIMTAKSLDIDIGKIANIRKAIAPVTSERTGIDIRAKKAAM